MQQSRYSLGHSSFVPKATSGIPDERCGRRIEAATFSLDEPTNASEATGNEERVSPMKPMFDWYDNRGLVGNSSTLRAILDREPRTLRSYLEEPAA